MGLENRIKATAKNIEGNIQEVVGDITGNTQNQVEGKAKQAEAHVRHVVENVKDKLEQMKNTLSKGFE
ncbi:CsbD family protein [Brasilonema sp. CT11]|nr:CsbD family protein [Brasilonema sp. CT11]